jgi:hypothetical protein
VVQTILSLMNLLQSFQPPITSGFPVLLLTWGRGRGHSGGPPSGPLHPLGTRPLLCSAPVQMCLSLSQQETDGMCKRVSGRPLAKQLLTGRRTDLRTNGGGGTLETKAVQGHPGHQWGAPEGFILCMTTPAAGGHFSANIFSSSGKHTGCPHLAYSRCFRNVDRMLSRCLAGGRRDRCELKPPHDCIGVKRKFRPMGSWGGRCSDRTSDLMRCWRVHPCSTT